MAEDGNSWYILRFSGDNLGYRAAVSCLPCNLMNKVSSTQIRILMKMEIVAARKFGKTMKVGRITSLAKHALKY